MKKIVLISAIFLLFIILFLGTIMAAPKLPESDPHWTANFTLYKDFWDFFPIWSIAGDFIFPTNSSKDIVFGGTNETAPFRFKTDKGRLVIDTRSLGGRGISLNLKCGDVTGSSCLKVGKLPMSVDMETGKGFEVQVIDEIKARGMIYSDGSYFMGDGTNMRDIGFLRTGIKTMQIASDKLGGPGNLDITGNLLIRGTTNSLGGFIIGAFIGISDDSSYWLCTSKDCNSTCQVNIQGGLIVGCE